MTPPLLGVLDTGGEIPCDKSKVYDSNDVLLLQVSMVKFGREQTYNQILEWRPWYIQYDLLTDALMSSVSRLHQLVAEKDRAAAAAAGADMAQLVKIRTGNVNEYGYFLELVVSEITRASSFYAYLLEVCQRQIKRF